MSERLAPILKGTMGNLCVMAGECGEDLQAVARESTRKQVKAALKKAEQKLETSRMASMQQLKNKEAEHQGERATLREALSEAGDAIQAKAKIDSLRHQLSLSGALFQRPLFIFFAMRSC